MTVFFVSRVLHLVRLWLAHHANLLCLLCTIIAAGCTTLGNEFVVDTTSFDPIIYSPGSAPNKVLWVPLEGLELTCEGAVASRSETSTFVLMHKLWASSGFPRNMVIAKIDPSAALTLASGLRANGFEKLLDDLGKLVSMDNDEKCALQYRADTPAANQPRVSPQFLAAAIIHRHLPRPYSAMLRSAYNHRAWPENESNTIGISIDISAGMRLRLENSVPISPEGIASSFAHPSSFASPTYLYFHSYTGAELCASGARSQLSHGNFLCNTEDKEEQKTFEKKVYLSPSSGLVRLGVMQYRYLPDDTRGQDVQAPKSSLVISGTATIAPVKGQDSASGPPSTYNVSATMSGTVTTTAHAGDSETGSLRQASSLIDLFDWTQESRGARSHWRLWIPVQRDTVLTTPIQEQNGGSTEPPESVPLLISADRLEDLARIDFSTRTPCAVPKSDRWTCYSLHYRVVPVPEIVITVNGVRQWWPIGSTLQDVVADRLQDGFAARPHHFTNGVDANSDHDIMQKETVAKATPLARAVLANIEVFRHHRKGLHLITASEIMDATQTARFLRLQLMPGDEIKWQ